MRCIVKKTVDLILSSGNDYLIQVKNNQKYLLRQIKHNISHTAPIAVDHQEERNRGRKEIRHLELYDNIEGIDPSWSGLSRIIYVKRSGHRKETGAYEQQHYYITSVTTNDARYLAQGIRGHWEIENRLHYVKDVHFNEDGCRINVGQAVQVQSILINASMNIYRALGFRSIKKATIHFANKIKELHALIDAPHINKI